MPIFQDQASKTSWGGSHTLMHKQLSSFSLYLQTPKDSKPEMDVLFLQINQIMVSFSKVSDWASPLHDS
jgi:hypothetical protein